MAIASRYAGFYDYPFTKIVTGDTSYFTAHVFCFQGTNNLGVPKEFHIIAGWIDNTTQSIRVYDIDNNQVICERTDVTDEFPKSINMGALSNLPEMPAVWEIQTKRLAGPGGAKEVAVASAYMVF